RGRRGAEPRALPLAAPRGARGRRAHRLPRRSGRDSRAHLRPAVQPHAVPHLRRRDAVGRAVPARCPRAPPRHGVKETAMKFLLTYAQNPNLPPPSPEKMAQIGAFTAKNIAAGIVVMTGGLVRPSKGVQ